MGDESDPLNLAGILRQASDAIARAGGISAGPDMVNAVSTLAMAVADMSSASGTRRRGAARSTTPDGPLGEGDLDVDSFVERHELEPWVAEALQLLTPAQRAKVVNPPLEMEGPDRVRNPSAVMSNRIRHSIPLEKRVEIFIKVNDLGEGVVDRLGTLTPEQTEAVMETGLKLMKAANPSGVAMARISSALRKFPGRERAPKGQGRGSRGYEGEGRSRSPPGARGRGPAVGGAGRPRHLGGDRGGSAGVAASDVQGIVDGLGLEWWCGEVLRRLSLFQRQAVLKELGNMSGVRNPSGVVMSRVRAVADPNDLTAIFIDLNGLDTSCEEKLWALTPDQRAAVIAPGIYVQNVRNPVTAVLSRIQNVLDGAHAIGGKGGRGGAGAAAAAAPWRPVASPSSSSSGSSERRRRRRRRR